MFEKYAREVVEELAMQKVLSKKWKASNAVSSRCQDYSKLSDDAGVFDEKRTPHEHVRVREVLKKQFEMFSAKDCPIGF